MNIDSSRSHAVLILALRRTPSEERSGGVESEEVSLGRLYLVDLAGSERVKRSGLETSSQEFSEACAINASLTTLGRCIQILAGKAKKGTNPPFRESVSFLDQTQLSLPEKLTFRLRHSGMHASLASSRLQQSVSPPPLPFAYI